MYTFTNRQDARHRLEKALTFVETYMSSTKPGWLSTREIDRHFGSNSRPLGKWLRSKLLICTNESYSYKSLNKKCKQYIKNKDGVSELSQLLYGTVQIQLPVVATPAEQQQLDTGNFIYEEKANRYFNSIQHKPNIVKRPLLAKNGYIHNYDIQCCAPTLLLQYSRKCGLQTPTPRLDSYLADRTAIRNELASSIGITTDQVKLVINALLNGGKITHKEDSHIYIAIGQRHLIIDRLKESQYLKELRKEISDMWRSIKPHRTPTYITDKNGRTRCRALSPKNKSEIYREQEQIVLKEIQRYLKKTNNTFLLEHDGWTCREAIDITELRSLIKSMTGYVLNFDWNKYE
jgi:hypothetical protein